MAKTFAGCLEDVLFLQAKFQFVGSSDDELSFNKGDVIVVTKKDDGGWWEGTLDGKIGWFPNNYANPISADPEPTPDELPSSSITEEAGSYHTLVVENILQTQKRHLEELKGFLEKYLTPLKSSDILTKQDRDTLAGNYEEIVDFQHSVDKELEAQSVKPIPEQRIGKGFLEMVTQMKEIYLHYCSNHPHAANLLAQHGEQLAAYMESIGAPPPGNMLLTSMLSKPFLHVEKYGNQIKELERHIEEDHIDNLDMKKATQVLQIIALSCNEVRKKKEMELQMLTGDIDGWKGEPIMSLGSLVHMGQVFVEKEDVSRRERYFCLFPKDLIILAVSPELVGYCFEDRHPLSEVSAKNVEDTDTFFNGFHLTVSDKVWYVMTSSPREKDAWMEALKTALGNKCTLDFEKEKPVTTNLGRSDSKRSEVKSLPIADGDLDTTDFINKRSYSVGLPSAQFRVIPPRSAGSSPVPQPELTKVNQGTTLSAVRGAAVRQPVKKEWSFTRLRPTPPYIQQKSTEGGSDMRRMLSSKKIAKGSKEDLDSFARKQSTPAFSTPISDKQLLEEDMMILSVIEAYCFSTRSRQPVNCGGSPDHVFIPPDVPPHFSFKPITPPRVSHMSKQKTMKKFKKKPRELDANAEMVGLKQQVQNLHKQTLYLRENLEEERKSRENFEKFLKKVLTKVAPDIDWTEDTALQKTTPL